MSTLGEQVDAQIRAAQYELRLLDDLAAWALTVDQDDVAQWRSFEVSFSGIDSTWEVTLYAWNHETVSVKRKRRHVALAKALEITARLA